MWSRKLSSSIGMDQEDFTRAFIAALKNQSVIKTLREAICGELQKEVRDLREIIKSKDTQLTELKDKIHDLEATTDDLEQYSRRNSLRFTGVPEQDHEDTGEVSLDLIHTQLGIKSITIKSIDRVHRVGPKRDNQTTRPILVKFATYRERNDVFKSRSNLKGKTVGGNHIYINEDLTQVRSRLLYRARQMKREGKVVDCWTHDGQLFVKNKHRKIMAIKGETDLQKSTT